MAPGTTLSTSSGFISVPSARNGPVARGAAVAARCASALSLPAVLASLDPTTGPAAAATGAAPTVPAADASPGADRASPGADAAPVASQPATRMTDRTTPGAADR